MEFTNKLVEKYGTDKLLHFLVGAWLMAEAKVSHNMFIIGMMFLFIVVISFIKEKYLDGNKHDVYLGVRGEQLKVGSKGLKLEISLTEVLGTSTNLFVRLPNTTKEYILTINERVNYQSNENLYVELNEKFVHLFDYETEETIMVGKK